MWFQRYVCDSPVAVLAESSGSSSIHTLSIMFQMGAEIDKKNADPTGMCALLLELLAGCLSFGAIEKC